MVSEPWRPGCADCLELRLQMDENVEGHDQVVSYGATIVDGRAVCLSHAKARIRANWPEDEDDEEPDRDSGVNYQGIPAPLEGCRGYSYFVGQCCTLRCDTCGRHHDRVRGT